jgi:hypothetical protein
VLELGGPSKGDILTPFRELDDKVFVTSLANTFLQNLGVGVTGNKLMNL